MSGSKRLSKIFRVQSAPLAGVLAVFLAALAAYIDWSTWIELNVSIVYGLPLVLSVATRSRRLLWGMTAFLVAMTFVVYSDQIPPGVFSLHEFFFVNRVLAAAAVLLTACLLHLRISAIDKMEAQRIALRQQNERLERANQELLRREQQIVHQNEELDRRHREAEEASRRKTRLLASASHDIRMPVNSINLMAEVIRQAAGNPSLATQIPDLAERLQANASSLGRLISDLLDVARFDSGRIEVQESVFLLDHLLVELCREQLPLAHAKNLRLEVAALEQPIELRTDRIKLARVISNVLGNAIKFTQIGSVAVSASVTSDQVLIRVRDSGVGIAAAHLDRIFEEFTQLQHGERGPSEGWGLGLAICSRLMDALGGSIAVESELGQGSLFIISLPLRCLVEGSGTAGGVAEVV